MPVIARRYRWVVCAAGDAAMLDWPILYALALAAALGHSARRQISTSGASGQC